MEKEFSQLFVSSINEYKSKFQSFLIAFLFLYFIPSIIIFGLLALIAGSFFLSGFSIFDANAIADLAVSESEILFTPLVIGSLFVLGIIFGIIMIFLNIIYLHIAFSKKEVVDFKESFNVAKNYFWKYFGLFVILSISLFVLFLLFIIPGIIFLVYWLFAFYILMNEKVDITESIKRSKKLVEGRWWTVFGYLLLISLMGGIICGILNFIPFIGEFVASLIVTPFTILFFKNFYLELKKSRK